MKSKKMSSGSSVGGMRKLPKDVIQNILMCLPIRDAIRTSILSRSWRYEWSTLPSLIFDRDHSEFADDQNQEEYNRKIVKIVDQVFLLHRGPIYEFSISFRTKNCAAIDRWILFLSRNGIRKLALRIWNGETYTVPSCLFSCEDITYLVLYWCKFNPPSSFKGFSKLTEMNLLRVDLTEDVLRILISLPVHLKKLTLMNVVGCTRFKLCAKELVSFSIVGEVEDLYFESTPLLAYVYLELSFICNDESVASIKSSRIVEALCRLPSIERLNLVGPTLQNLSFGDIPASLPAVCPLKQLSMHIDFDDVQELLAAFCIFRSSPLLQKLTMEFFYVGIEGVIFANDFWQEEEDFNCEFTHLETVEVTIDTGGAPELKFIEYIAGNAPLLETLQIKFADDVPDEEKVLDESKVFRELLQIRRCSAKAKIIVLPQAVPFV